MVLIDYNQLCFSNVLSLSAREANVDKNEDLIRHAILSTILYYKKKFGKKYGDLIFCCDDFNYWRKEYFKHYKASRKEKREQSNLDWDFIFKVINKIKQELTEIFPYKLIQVSGAEADDIIAGICYYTNSEEYVTGNIQNGKGFGIEPILILSSDGDFLQLQKFQNVEQYSPIQRKFLKENEPDKYLKEHIIRGDSGDGIPNIFSDDATFVEKRRSKKIMTEKLNTWILKEPKEVFDELIMKNYERNEMLIDLSKTPLSIKEKIVESFVEPNTKDRKKLFNYFIKNKLKNLMENIGDF